MIRSTRRVLVAQLRSSAHHNSAPARTSRAVATSAGLYCGVVTVWILAVALHTPPATLPIQLLGVVALFAALAGVTALWISTTRQQSPREPQPGAAYEGWAIIRRVYRHRAHHGMVNVDITVPGNACTYNRTIGCPDVNKYCPGMAISVLVDSPDCGRVLLGQVIPH